MRENISALKEKEMAEVSIPLATAAPAPKSKFKKSKLMCYKCFTEYSQHSSIHGIQYLGEKRRPILERIFWILVFIVSVSICFYMIFKLWIKWEETPVIVSFNERETDIWKIPFPSVTICPEDKYDIFFDYEAAMDLDADSTLKQERQALSLVCENITKKISKNDYLRYNESTPLDFDPIKILEELQPIPVIIATWQGKVIPVRKILTEAGFCFNFNMLAAKDLYNNKCIFTKSYMDKAPKTTWNRELGYEHDHQSVYPRRNIGAGLQLGLIVQILSDHTNYCSKSRGYKVLVHSPDNFPRISTKYFRLPQSQDVVAAIKVNMITTSKSLRSYSPEKRQCYFIGEKKLKYFKVYTQNNCDVECLTEFVLNVCNCVWFSMPRFPNTKICFNATEVECYKEAEMNYLETRYSDPSTNTWDCQCLPPCHSVEYNIETSQADFDPIGNDLSLDEQGLIQDKNFAMAASQISIFFKESSFLTSKRSELYGISEFVANCGGLLGLFMGVSALSFIEIFYFSVVRTYTNRVRRRRQ